MLLSGGYAEYVTTDARHCLKLPDGKILMPGVISHATDLVEHPDVVKDRLINYASVVGKENVGIKAVEPVGQYAVKLVFDDGHDTGIYSFDELYRLGRDRESIWAEYVQKTQG